MKRSSAIVAAAVGLGMLLFAWRVGAHDVVKGNRANGERPSTVLKAFPLDAQAYSAEVAQLVREGIPERYGHEEWAAIVLTHEFHQHVGIYTVLGAKMGVRARQILDAPMRAVRVTAETGRKQPLSCTVDGLQAALGSTLGQNLIEVPETTEPTVEAVFEYNGRKVRLRLTPEYADRIDAIITEAREKHGGLTPAYFKAVEAATYRVWADFDRAEIFSAEETLRPLQ